MKFPCLRLAFDALHRGGTAPAILNAANEIAVQAFLEQKIRFMEIPALIECVLNDLTVEPVTQLSSVILADEAARHAASAWLKSPELVTH